MVIRSKRQIYIGILALLCIWLVYPYRVLATSGAADTVGLPVVVIDPGHGGENNGDESTPLFEKYRTMITAQAMYEELQKYEGVQVYMTRTEDVDMSLKERAEFAAGVHADMLYSIHYNASLEHEIFGAEIWIPSAAPYQAPGYQYARLWVDQMRQMGLHLRGIKCRTGNNGDYYGVIRESAALGIPAVILEHCHLDVPSDLEFADTEEEMKAFGRADATAVAQYFGLKSESLGVDYSNTKLAEISSWEAWVFPLGESTAPENCVLTKVAQNEESGEVTFRIDAEDSNEGLQYYDYSLDGGASYGHIALWPDFDMDKNENTGSVTFKVTLPREDDTEIIARVYNAYDQKTESEPVTIHFAYQDEMREAALAWEAEQAAGGDAEGTQSTDTGGDAAEDVDVIEDAAEDAAEDAIEVEAADKDAVSAEAEVNAELPGMQAAGSPNPAAPAAEVQPLRIVLAVIIAVLVLAIVLLGMDMLRSSRRRRHRKEKQIRKADKKNR
ncbi:MAG: N-acetylmuramoyl-L-alanine amidase [Lachnospiraceae bacterium]|nr:N-acetylmuramoyl-L-alanine amidase [Lachnospiraceae bacterium]